MRVLVTADGKVLHDDSDPENILSGITAFELACLERNKLGISANASVKIQMFNTEFTVELPAEEVADIIKQYGG